MRQLPVSQKTNAVSVPVLLHSPVTCSSSSSCSDAMRILVLAAFAAPLSLHDLLYEYNSAKSVFIHPPTPRVLPRLRPGSLSPGDAPDPSHERAASGAPSASLGHPGMHSSLQKLHQVRSARVRRHTVFNLAPPAEHSADILVPPCRQTPAQCGFFRSRLLMICASTTRHTAAAARLSFMLKD